MSGTSVSRFATDDAPKNTAMEVADQNGCPVQTVLTMVRCLQNLSPAAVIRVSNCKNAKFREFYSNYVTCDSGQLYRKNKKPVKFDSLSILFFTTNKLFFDVLGRLSHRIPTPPRRRFRLGHGGPLGLRPSLRRALGRPLLASRSRTRPHATSRNSPRPKNTPFDRHH